MSKFIKICLTVSMAGFFGWPLIGMLKGADAAAWSVAVGVTAFGLFIIGAIIQEFPS